MILVEDLPSIKNVSSDKNKDKYCTKSNIKRWMLDQYCNENKSLARNIMSCPVKNGTGDRWGVLIFDSMNSTGIDHAKAHGAFCVTIEPLGVLLEGV